MFRSSSATNRRHTVPLALATVLGLGCRNDLVLGTIDALAMERRDAAAVNATDGGGNASVDAAIDPDGARVDPGTAPDAATAGRTAVKFCNLWYNHPMTLEIGPEPVRLAAELGKCAPPLGEPCPTIPGGPVEVVLRFDANRVAGMANADLMLDRQYIFSLEPRYGRPFIEGLVGYLLPAGASCPAVEARLPDPDGGTPADRP
jgi:hypothetical protein